MIESKIIEWLDFNDSIKNIDIYSRKKLTIFFELLRTLQIQKNFPLILNILFILLFFIQICTMSIMFIPSRRKYNFRNIKLFKKRYSFL